MLWNGSVDPNAAFTTPGSVRTSRTTRSWKARRFGASAYFDCGSATGIPNTTSYTLRIKGWTQVEPNEIGTTTLRTRVEASARQEGVQQGSVLCASKSKLEEKIASLAMVRAMGG